eukprot:14887-Heterococcus_DN1.PRE.1
MAIEIPGKHLQAPPSSITCGQLSAELRQAKQACNDYFGVAPLRPLLQPAREAESHEELCLSASIFIE